MSKQTIRQIKLTRLRENPDNIRTRLTHLDELAASIRRHGVRVPLLVHRKYAAGSTEQDLEIVFGHRRAAAAQIAGLTTVPCTLVPYMTPQEQILAMITENEEREVTDDEGMALAVRKLRDRFQMSTLQIAEQTNTSIAQVQAWLNGGGRIAPVAPGPTELPERPANVASISSQRAASERSATRRADSRVIARQIGVTRKERPPMIGGARILDVLKRYDSGELTAEEAVGRFRGLLKGWQG